MTDPIPTPPAPPPPPEATGTDLPKIVIAIVLLVVAGYLVSTRYSGAAVDWYLGDLKRDPGDVNARNAFRRLGERAVPRLEQELTSPTADNRVVAVLALMVIEGPGAERLLALATRDEDGMAASNALFACAGRTDPLTAAALSAALGDRRPGVRLAARRALERRGQGVPPWWALGAGS